MGDMGHHGVVAVDVLLAPHLLKQLLTGHHLPPVAAQIPQNREFQRCEGQLLPVQGALVGNLADVQAVELVFAAFFRLGRLIVLGVAAQLSLDPGQQLQWLKGLVM